MPFTAKGYRARDLRKTMTAAEVALWSQLKTLRAEGFHIRRQAPVQGYYADFVCFSRRLIIEVDGQVHARAEQIAHDRTRDAVLHGIGFRVLRISNEDVRGNLEIVVKSIRAALEEAPVSPPGSRGRREPPSP